MTASKTPRPLKCRYCKKRVDEHDGSDHAFRVYTHKKRASSNSFLKAEIAVLQEVFRLAVLGQPVTVFVVRSEGFSGAMNKITKMAKAIETAERLDKIGEEQDERQQQQTVA